MSKDVDTGCAVCHAPAEQRCAKCRVARYCGKEHQRAHWRAGHRAACHPYAVATSAELGRHWVAARDIAAGEVLLEERPLAVGPKAGAAAGVCLSCYAVTRSRCSACGWPACGPRCEAAAVHRDAECPLIAGHYDADRQAAYCFVLPLRCALIGDRECRVAFRSLQSHLDRRLGTPLYRAYAVNVAAFVLDRLGLRGHADADGSPHDDRSVLRAAAALDTNAFDVRRPGGRQCHAVYARASMMAHSCTPNTKHVFVGDAADGRPIIRVVAAVAVPRGAPVTATYTHTLWCTRDRRRHLAAAKCFECACARCHDPTEGGTHLGSAACGACDGGRATEAHGWTCDRCGQRTASDDGPAAAEARRLVRSLDKTDVAGFERFLERVRIGAVPPLHDGHHVAVGVKYALAQLYADRLSGLTTTQLKNNTGICEELLRLADVLEPGITRFRGLLLFYLVRGLKQLKSVENKQTYDKMIENYTGKAIAVLKTEPDLEYLVDQLE